MENEGQEWLTGHFLISDVNLIDPNFRRSVVLMINHDENGALGLVVNRRLDVTLGEVMPDFDGTSAGKLPIYQGGPVQPQYLFAIHSGLPDAVRSEHASNPIEHVTFELTFHTLVDYLRDDWAELGEKERPPINLYAGYSGWEGGQLERELEHGSWIVRPAAAKHIFSVDPDEGWRAALGELGGIHKIVAEISSRKSVDVNAQTK